jgi:hypothetical protein
MAKGVILIVLGLASMVVLAFASYHSKSQAVKMLFLAALLVGASVIVYSGIENIRSDRALKGVQQRVEPRHLLDRAKFIAFLKEYRRGPVEVRCSSTDVEARNFAIEIDSALKEAGWDSRLNDHVIFSPQPVGLIFWIHSVTSIPDHAGSLQQAFKAIDTPTKTETYETVPEGTFVLAVGSKA